MLALSVPAMAQEEAPPDEEGLEEAHSGQSMGDLLEDLKAEIEQLSVEFEASSDALTHTESLLDAASTLGDTRKSEAERIAAAEEMAGLSDVRAVAFLWMGVRDESDAVRAAVYAAAAAFPGEDTTSLGRLGLMTESGVAVESAAALLVAQHSPEAGAILYDLAQSAEISPPARAAAKKALSEGYPELIAEKGEPAAVSGKAGSFLMASANAVLGGVALGSLGEFGQDDAAIVIGSVGGAGIGAGGSFLYTRLNPVSDGQGLAYASATSWGLAAGHMLGDIYFPEVGRFDSSHGDWTRAKEELSEKHDRWQAVLRTAGVLVGAGLGTNAFSGEPDSQDVMEVNLGGYLGAQIGIGLVDVFNQMPEDYEDTQEPTYYGPCYDYNYVEDCENFQEWEADRAAADAWRGKRYRIQRGVGLVGAAGGAALAYNIRSAWQPGPADLAYASVAGVEGMALGAGTPIAIWDEYRDGGIRLGFHMGSMAGLAYAHSRPVTYDQTTFTAWNTAAANLLGSGIATIGDDELKSYMRIMMPIGAAGFAYGTWMGEDVVLTQNDRMLVSVGTSLGTWNSFMLGYIVDQGDTGQVAVGLGQIGTALSAMGSIYATKKTDVDLAYSAFVGTSAAWGLFYAGAAGIAIDPDWSDRQSAAVLLASSDVGAGFAAWAGSDSGFVRPQDAALASLGGLTGATLGSLITFMATDEESAVAVGSMIGATLGLAGGAYLTPRLRKKGKAKEQVALRVPDLPGEWRWSLSPALMENGDLGAQIGLSAFGF